MSCGSGKVRYESKRAARSATQHFAGVVYKCALCSGWHHSMHTSKRSRKRGARKWHGEELPRIDDDDGASPQTPNQG